MYVTSILPSLRSCSQKPSTLLASTFQSVVMSVTSSFTQNARCCSAMIPNGRKNLQMISSTLPWVLSTVPKWWIGRLLPAIPPYRRVWPKHRSLPRQWPSGLQQNTATNWKDQKGNVQNFPRSWLKDNNRSKQNHREFPRHNACPAKWQALSIHQRR